MYIKANSGSGGNDGDYPWKHVGRTVPTYNYTTMVMVNVVGKSSAVINLDSDLYDVAWSTDDWSSAYATTSKNTDTTVNVSGKNFLYLGVKNNKAVSDVNFTVNNVVLS